MIVSKQIAENMCEVFMNFNTREQFDEEFKSIIKSFLTDTEGKIESIDIFNNLFVAFVACGKGEDFVGICKVMSELDLNKLKEYLKEAGDE